jgi:hypothetical protein
MESPTWVLRRELEMPNVRGASRVPVKRAVTLALPANREADSRRSRIFGGGVVPSTSWIQTAG